LLQNNADLIGARVVRRMGSYFVLNGRERDGSHAFLTLDFMVDSEVGGFILHQGEEVLTSRRPEDGYWIPAAGIAFGCYLARTLAKGGLDQARAERLSRLFREDPSAGLQQVASFWASRSAARLVGAARSGDWAGIRAEQNQFGSELRRRAAVRNPVGVARYFAARR
jgi:hypothetical protein